MARPAGSKNKAKEQKDSPISEVESVDAEDSEKASTEIDDLLGTPKRDKKFYGYHTITGAEVWL